MSERRNKRIERRKKKKKKKKKRISSLTRRPFTVPLRHGSLQTRLRLHRGTLVVGCKMRGERANAVCNREPQLIKRRRAIVNDPPRLVIKDRWNLSKRVTVARAIASDRCSSIQQRQRAHRAVRINTLVNMYVLCGECAGT